MKIGICILAAAAMLFALPAVGESRKLTLQEAIDLAKEQSVDAEAAMNEFRSIYWEHIVSMLDLLPEINLSASLPNYNLNYTHYQQSDGSYTYVRNNYLGLSGTVSIDQKIPFTGGTISINTSLDYLRQIGSSNGERYMSIPFAVTLNQPVFGTNNLKWDRKIVSAKFSEAKAKIYTRMEEVKMEAINLYFNLLLAKENVGISRQNLANAQKLYEVAKAKRKMGQISGNDLLQMELNVLDSQSELTDNESSLKSAMFQLRSFLGLDENVTIEPVIPQTETCSPLSYEDVLQKARENNYFSKNALRRQMEAQYSTAVAKGNMRSITLFAQIGYTGTDATLRQAYSNLGNNQIVQVGLKIPILDWGKRKGQVRMAEINQKLVESRLEQEEMEFNQNIFILTEQFNNQTMQLENAALADSIARKRYSTNIETYMIGRISTLDLNDSQTKKDYARQKYINEMFWWWYYYYRIRSITLWDYMKNAHIDIDIDKLLIL